MTKKAFLLVCLLLGGLAVSAQPQKAQKPQSPDEILSLEEAKSLFEGNCGEKTRAALAPSWETASMEFSADSRFASFVIPLGSAPTSRLVIQKDNDNKHSALYILEIVPAGKLKDGDNFTGDIVYRTVSGSRQIAVDRYKDGRLVYSQDLRYADGEDPSIAPDNLNARLGQLVSFYEGSLSGECWPLVAANRPRKAESSYKPGEIVAQATKKLTGAKPAAPAESGSAQTPLRKIFSSTSGVVTSMVEKRQVNNDLQKNKVVTRFYLYFDNKDACDYYVHCASGMSYTANVGRTDVESFDAWPATSSAKQSVDNSRKFRGKPLAKADSAFVYALPVKDGVKVSLTRDRTEKNIAYQIQLKAGEPVCAMRAGVVCKTDDPSRVLVYHNDGTFAAYLNVAKASVAVMDKVLPGDQIAESGPLRPVVAFGYLDAKKFSKDGVKSFPYSFFTPVFRSAAGDKKLETGAELTAKIDEALIVKEMSKAAQKKYLKK